MITCERYHAVLPVGDIAASIDFYTTKLRFALDFTMGDPIRFAAVSFGDNSQLFLEAGTRPLSVCGLYFVVNDADAMFDVCRAAGAKVVAEMGDRAYELRDFSIQDPDGYVLTFGHRIECIRSSES